MADPYIFHCLSYTGPLPEWKHVYRSPPPRIKIPEEWLIAVAEHVRERMWQYSGDCVADTVWSLCRLG